MEESIGQVLTEGHLEFTCPKCGGATRMRWGNATYGYCRYSGLCDRLGITDPLKRDHLHVICQNCGYEWLEKPLDAAAEIKKS